MQEAALRSSENTAQRDIAQSLKMLFGGIDLDPTDRFVAAFLVAEEQHRRRRQHATAMLEASGRGARRCAARRRLRNWVGGGAAARQQQWGACLLGPEAVAGGVSAHQAAQGEATRRRRWTVNQHNNPPRILLLPRPRWPRCQCRHTVLQLVSAADALDSDEDVEKGAAQWVRASSESRSAATANSWPRAPRRRCAAGRERLTARDRPVPPHAHAHRSAARAVAARFA